MEDDFYDPLYKGATAPSLIFGVPLVPLVIMTGVFAQAALLGFVFGGLGPLVLIGMLYLVAFREAKRISKADDQRLMQMMLRARMRISQRPTKKLWGAVSFSPLGKRK